MRKKLYKRNRHPNHIEKNMERRIPQQITKAKKGEQALENQNIGKERSTKNNKEKTSAIIQRNTESKRVECT